MALRKPRATIPSLGRVPNKDSGKQIYDVIGKDYKHCETLLCIVTSFRMVRVTHVHRKVFGRRERADSAERVYLLASEHHDARN